MENEKQAKKNEYQKKAIFDLKKLLAKSDEASINLSQNDIAVTSNQSLPREPLILSTTDSLISKPHGKRMAISMYFYFYRFWLLTKKNAKFNSSVFFSKDNSEKNS